MQLFINTITFYRPIKIRPNDISSSTYIDFGNEKKDKDLKFKVADHVRISKNNLRSKLA